MRLAILYAAAAHAERHRRLRGRAAPRLEQPSSDPSLRRFDRGSLGLARSRRCRSPCTARTISSGPPTATPTTSSSFRSATRGATTTCGPTSSATRAWSCFTTRSCTTRARGRCSAGSGSPTIAPSSHSITRELPPEAAEPAINGFARAAVLRLADAPRARQLGTPRGRAQRQPRRRPARAFPETPIDAIRMGVAQPASIRRTDRRDPRPARHSARRHRHRRLRRRVGREADRPAPQGSVRRPGLRAANPRPTGRASASPLRRARPIARELGIDDIVTCTGYVPDDEVGSYLAIADVVSCLRWPSARETSASWLRAIAAGRATIVTDLVAADRRADAGSEELDSPRRGTRGKPRGRRSP